MRQTESRGPSTRAFALVLLAAALAGQQSAAAQIPDTFTNLKVFDADISRADLVGAMQGWTKALDVRCTHCHVGPDNLQGMDFATDEKAAKRTARRMLTMSYEINAALMELPVLAESDRTQPQRVLCITCHRGLPTPPLPTETELELALEAGGAEAAVARFAELETTHAGAGRYDLTSLPLFQLGRTLIQSGRHGPAGELLTVATERFPDDADLAVLLGQAALDGGDLEAARAAVKRAREIEPGNRFSVWLEGQIESAVEQP